VIGRYPLLDKLVKVIMVVLAVSTVAAVVAAAMAHRGKPAVTAPVELWNLAGFSFLIALVGWMPSAVDISVWHSLWTLERARETGHRPRLREALLDFNLGYLGTAVLALMFLSLGALVFFGRGEEIATTGVGFANQLIELYSSSLGHWARPVIVVAAFTTMFSTTLTVTDAFPRALERTVEILAAGEPGPIEGGAGGRRRIPGLYWLWMVILVTGSLTLMSVFQSSLTRMVDLATTLSFLTSPILGYLNYRAVMAAHMPDGTRPSLGLRVLTWVGLIFGVAFGVAFLVWRFHLV